MIIYKITNRINVKVYIGQTKRTLERRWKEHCCPKGGCPLLKRAINKYGKENFTVEQIDVANDVDELNKKEIYWIDYYKSANENYGYNLSLGGEIGTFNESTLKKMSLSHTGDKNYFYGKHHTEASKRKMSETSKIKNNFVKVRCVETGEIFNSIVEASKKYNIAPTHITRVCRGGRNMTGGFDWECAGNI